MPIYKVTSEGIGSYGCAMEFVIRAIDNLEAIDLAIEHEQYNGSNWTRANSRAEIISEKGKSEIILEANFGA
tara:strand:- start:458 stop:673 length:216 start_codon:yes stop_codon:yes gene_type:complete